MIDTILWLGALVFFLFMESSTVVLVSIWFAAGSLVALIASLLSAPIWLQVVLFFLVSGVLLAALRPFVRKFIKTNLTPTNVDSTIGMEGYVTEDIDNIAACGAVKLGSVVWTARSDDGSRISAGTLVKVERIEGVKAIVTPVIVEEFV